MIFYYSERRQDVFDCESIVHDIMKKHLFSCIFTFATALATGISLILPVTSYADEYESPGWAADIYSLLASGDYAEGEAVAGVIAKGNGDNSLLNEGEEIMDITDDSSKIFEEEIPDDGEVHIVYIHRDDMSTEEILLSLADDDRVLFAEPNYLLEKNDSEQENNPTNEVCVSVVRTENLTDLTPYQWGYSDNSSLLLEGKGHNSIHVPGFAATGSNMEGEPVVVAVLDSAIDFTHPDLAPVAYTFTQEQQDLLGCDLHGYNATSESTDGKLAYFDKSIHGTHCAGIIGAAWDGEGVSGVASNVKLVSVQNCTDNGYTSLVNALRGFEFIDRANELGCNISVTSNSWSLIQDSKALNAAVRKLGDKWGVVSVFAAANEGKNLEYIGEIMNTIYDNPYAIVVGATDSSGQIAPYSNFGKSFVDLGSPGSGILSTINVNDEVAWYISDAVQSTNLFYEGFEDETVSVTFTQSDGTTDTIAPSGSVTESSHFSGNKSLKLPLDGEKTEKGLKGETIYSLYLNLGDVSDLGVSPGNMIGFSMGAMGDCNVGGLSYINSTDNTEEVLYETKRGQAFSDGWTCSFAVIPEELDLQNVIIKITLVADKPLDAVYLDSVGIGSEKVPYMILDGTSMACPAISGATAVLKAANPNLGGAKLAELVKSKVRESDSLKEITKSGGIFDFDVQGQISESKPTQDASGVKLFEESLPLDKGTGAPFAIDAVGDFETNGPLIGLDNKLYYLPAVTYVEESESYKRMFRFDTASLTWEELPELPEFLTFVSAVMYDGKILVKGTSMDILPDGSPAMAGDPKVKIYMYDPGSNSWTAVSSDGADHMDTLANNNGQLILVGGGGLTEDPVTREEINEPATVRAYDIYTGAGEVLAKLHKEMYRPAVACSKGVIYVLDLQNYTISKVTDGQSILLENALPEFYKSGHEGSSISKITHDTEKYGCLVPVDDGVIFAGPLAADGSGDTYLLRDGAETFELYEKRMSDNKVSFPAVASYRGFIYAIGSSPFEEGQRFFRRTAENVAEYAGDVTGENEKEDTPKDRENENETTSDDGDKKESGNNTPVNHKVKKTIVLKKSAAPETGDNANMVLYLVITFSSIAGIVACVVVWRGRIINK